MSLTIVEQIAVVIYERLRTLLIAGTENTRVKEVVRPTYPANYTPRDYQIVLTQGETEIIDGMGCPGNPPATCFVTTYDMRMHILPSETSTVPKATLLNQFVADVRKVITTPQNTWQQFDNLAFDARFGPTQEINDEGFDGTNLPLIVSYRTDENDPYTGRA